jgi:thiol-disulfide isomerase/thioredoxin
MKWKKELKGWLIPLGIFAFLYLTGWLTPVAGKIQSLILYTGILNASTETTVSEDHFDYNGSLMDSEGNKLNLTTLKGKTVFINVWATWCPPCRAEMPFIESLYEDLKSDEDIVFIMLSVDEKWEKAIELKNDKDYSFPIYTAIGRRPASLNSTVVPTSWVISPEGKIVYQHEGMRNFNTDHFKKFLKNL